MRQSKQDKIDQLEYTLKIMQQHLQAEKSNLSRLTAEHNYNYAKVTAERNHYREKADISERLLRIVETLSARKP